MKRIEKSTRIREKIFRIIFAGMMLLAGIYMLLGEWVFPQVGNVETYKAKVFDVDWEQILPDGSRVPIVVPGEYDADRDGNMQIEAVLPEIGSHTYIMIWSQRQDLYIYIGDELRQSYSTKDTRVFGKTSPACYVFVRLEPEDSGKVIRVLTEGLPGYAGTGILRTIYTGDRMDIWMSLLKSNLMEIVIAVLVILFGIASVVFGIVLRFSYRKQSHLEYLGWGVVVGALWIITNSSLRQLLFHNISVVNDIAFMMVIIIPMPFLIYLDCIQQRRYHLHYEIMETITVLDFILCVCLQAAGVREFSESFKWSALICVTAIIFIVITMIIDMITHRIKEYALLAIGFLGVGLSAIGQIYMYLQKTETPFSGSLIAMGLLFLLVISLIDTIRDILHMEEEKQQAIYASESKARFLAHMSHEIRTPINAVLGMNEMILNESSEEEIRSHALDIQSAGTTLLSLVNDILDFSKIESGKMELVSAEYEVASLMNDTYHMIMERARKKGLKLVFECSHTMPHRLLGDEGRIRQILINLLTNAVKYTNEGTVTLAVDWQPLEKGKLLLKIAVADTGIGIREEHLAKLFDSFERIDAKKNRNVEGSGLGLNITKSLLDLMEGSISVESTYGKGSTFFVVFPQVIVQQEPVGEQSFGANVNETLHRGEKEIKTAQDTELDFQAPDARILVVDDVPMNLKVVKGLLKTTLVQIDTAGSGKECLQRVQEKKYDMIFLDHMMPEMDGIETLHHMKTLERNPNLRTPVIMLTANAIVGAKEEYLQVGFEDYLSKPIDSRKLKKMLKRYLVKEMTERVEEVSETVSEPKSFLERVAFLNTANGMVYSGGSEELYEEIVVMFAADDKSQLIEQLYAAEDWKNYQIQVHALKGMARSIGADAFSEQAKEVEQATKNGEFAFVKAHHEELMVAYKKLLEQLKPLCAGK